MAPGRRELLQQFGRKLYRSGLFKPAHLSPWNSIQRGKSTWPSCNGEKQTGNFDIAQVSACNSQQISCLAHVPLSVFHNDNLCEEALCFAQQRPRANFPFSERGLHDNCFVGRFSGTAATGRLSYTGNGHVRFASSSGDSNSGPLPDPRGEQRPVRNGGTFQRPPPRPQGAQPPPSPPRSRFPHPMQPLSRPAPQQQPSPLPPRGGVVRPKAQAEDQQEKNPVPVQDARRINQAITAQYIRLVTPEGHKVLSRWEALQTARREGLDLVEVDGSSTPPVCKLLDYNKFKFQKRKKEKENKQKLVEKRRSDVVKEVRISSRTESRDLEMKADMAMKLLNKGYRVKFGVIVKKGDPPSVPEGLLSKLVDMVKDVGKLEWGPKVAGHRMDVLVRPVTPSLAKSKKKATAKEVKAVAVEDLSEADDEEEGEEDDNGDNEDDDGDEEEEMKAELDDDEGDGTSGGDEAKVTVSNLETDAASVSMASELGEEFQEARGELHARGGQGESEGIEMKLDRDAVSTSGDSGRGTKRDVSLLKEEASGGVG